jgi:tyrosyl-tRNA synthetase
MLLVHLQKAGHKPIALVGGATGMVGDPSGKSEERNLLDEKTLLINQKGVKKQLMQFLQFDPSLPNGAEMVNNYDWFKDMGFLTFIRDVGKHITVNYMMAKESVKKRISQRVSGEGDVGMSFTEFTYQLVQGYDYYWLYTHKNCKLQMGGSDQWGNIVTGTELVRRKAGGEAFAFTCPLITKADGGKFGKTEQGNIWLDPKRTTPYQFYQFWLNASDADAEKWIRIFTFLTLDEIEHITNTHEQDPGQRILQKRLAEEVTMFIHGKSELEKAVETTQKLFSNQTSSIESLSVEDLESLEGVVKSDYDKTKLMPGVDIVGFLAETNVFPSKGEARKTIQAGGVTINRKKVSDVHITIDDTWLLHDKYILVQKGKKNYYLVKLV